jgi:hypothetical protein
MSYFIFGKNLDNIEGTFCKLAENELDLNNLNLHKDTYKIIEESQNNFDLVKYGNKAPLKYNNDIITYIDIDITFKDVIFINPKTGEQKVDTPAKFFLKEYIENFKKQIKLFTNNNKNHVLFSRWDNYYNQLNSLNLDSIEFPLNKSLEQYFKDQNLPSLNPLQLP